MSAVVARPKPVEEPPPQAEPPKSRRARKWWLRALVTLILCVLVLLAGGGMFNWLSSFKREPPRQEDPGISKTYSVTVFRVEPVDLQRVITAFGTALADREVIVAAEVAGRVVEANRLEVGRAVKPPDVSKTPVGRTSASSGDLLVRIDPQTYEERVLQARKLIAQDDVELQRLAQEHENDERLLKTEESNVETSREEYQNAVDLRRQNVGTESAVRRAELELRRYEDAVSRLKNELALYDIRRQAILTRQDAHQSDLELAQLDLERTQVKPPFAGVISEVRVEQGQYVKPGDALIRLTDPQRVEVPLSLTLSDYLAIAALRENGRRIRVSLAENETAAGRWFSDPLNELRQAPEASERTRTVRIYTEVDNRQQDVPLLPGTFVHARIAGPMLPSAMVIPRDALVQGTVFVAVPQESNANGRASKTEGHRPSHHPATSDDTWSAVVERRAVTRGRTLQSLVLIEDGLAAGEWIVTTNLDVIFDGARLKIARGEGERHLADELADLRTPQVQIVEEPAVGQ